MNVSAKGAGDLMKEGWVLLDVRPPTETDKVRPRGGGSCGWRLACGSQPCWPACSRLAKTVGASIVGGRGCRGQPRSRAAAQPLATNPHAPSLTPARASICAAG